MLLKVGLRRISLFFVFFINTLHVGVCTKINKMENKKLLKENREICTTYKLF